MNALRTRLAAVAVVVVVVLPAGSAGAASRVVPSALLGLPVAQESIGKQLNADITSSGRAHYFERIELYSVRRPDGYLQATLEIGRFRAGTADGEDYFRRSLVDQIGEAQPIATRAGGTDVYVTSQKGLVIASWFRDHAMLILSIRDSFDQPKSLIRQALAIQP